MQHQADLFADRIGIFFHRCVVTVDDDLAAVGQQHGVELLGKRGFAAAVVTDDRHKLAALHIQAHAVHRIADKLALLDLIIAETHILNRNKTHSDFSQIAVEPHGSTSPVSLTRKPISSPDTLPPKSFCSSMPSKYSMTAGESPVV